MFFSLRITRAPSIRSGCGDPLSKMMMPRAAILCLRIESTQARSISPPPDGSSTMKSTSLMIHPIEVHDAHQATQLDAAAVGETHANGAVAVGRRKRISISAELDHRRGSSGVLQNRRPAARKKTQGVAGMNDPAARIGKSLHLVFVGIELAAAMDNVRIFEFDAVGGTTAGDESGGDDDRHSRRADNPA